jgi:adenylate cyclase
MKTGKILLLIIIILGIISCNTNQKKPPMAKHGILDLRNWDFEKDGNVRLDGDWEFYWHEFLTSKNFDSVKRPQSALIPRRWDYYKWNGKELPNYGYASYRLKILINPNQKIKRFGLKFPDQGTAFELYLKDSLIGKNGIIAKSKENAVPQYKPLLISFDNPGDTIEFVCWISNYHFHYGGLYFIPELGKENKLLEKVQSNIIYEYFIIGTLFVLSLLLFSFFWFRTKDIPTLMLGLNCFIMAFRLSATGERVIIRLFPEINWEVFIKMEAIWILSIPTVIYYIYKLFPNESKKFIIIMNFYFSFILLFFTLFTKATFNSHFIIWGQLYSSIYAIYLIYILINAIINKREGALIVLLAFLLLYAAMINESLYYRSYLNLVVTLPFSIFIFAISQMILLARNSANAFIRIENFAADMEMKVIERTREVVEKSKIIELEKDKSDKLLLNVLPESIAIRLKQGETTIADHFEEASVIFIDIADFTKLSAKSSPQMMVKMLNEIFTIFDKIAAKYGLEKIKTIGDCYMAAAGIPVPRKDHAEAIAMMALDVMETMKDYRYKSDSDNKFKKSDSDFQSESDSPEIKFRIGLDCGPIVAGVIGEQKFIYDLWGDMVNTASRMETNGIIGKIQVTERFKNVVSQTLTASQSLTFEERGEIEIKGKGKMRTWFLIDN